MSVHTHAYLQTYSMYKHTNATFISSYKYIRKRRKWVFRRKSITKKKIFIKTFLCLFQPSVPRGKAMAIASEKITLVQSELLSFSGPISGRVSHNRFVWIPWQCFGYEKKTFMPRKIQSGLCSLVRLILSDCVKEQVLSL